MNIRYPIYEGVYRILTLGILEILPAGYYRAVRTYGKVRDGKGAGTTG